MAGSWLKLRHDLIDAPEIRRLARACGVTKDDIYGKLFRTWSWFDRHSVNGVVAGEDLGAVDELIGLDGFAAALVSVGWLASNAVGIVIPNWERHNSDTAKERALAAVRQERARTKPPDDALSRSERDTPSEDCHATGVTRQDLDETRSSHSPREAWQRIRDAWHASGKLKAWKLDRPPKGCDARLADGSWVSDALAAIERLPECRWFKTPPTMIQLFAAGFVDKVLAGSFDEDRRTQSGKDFADAPPPPKGWSGPAEEARRAMVERTRRLREATA